MKLPIHGSAWVVAAFVALIACQRQTVEFTLPPEQPSFQIPTDGGASGEADAGLITYCPSSACPAGHTTCPTSRFRCDVDLNTDMNNCGACGAACPKETTKESYECLGGACVLSCQEGNYDCDGIPDNGCEAKSDNDNCGGCGKKCPDPDKPCLNISSEFVCGCKSPQVYCANSPIPCVNPKADDKNCGGCGNVCDSTNGGAPSYPNAYYGCSSGQCGALKCVERMGNCDGDVTNGCEASLMTNQNCGGCGLACPAGQECRLYQGVGTCMCEPGKTFCNGECYDLKSDFFNCGACGNSCRFLTKKGGAEACLYGVCTLQCWSGKADCNGNTADGCETDTDADPNNCGACGNTCDAVAGQACVGGKCMVEPCDPDAGGTTR